MAHNVEELLSYILQWEEDEYTLILSNVKTPEEMQDLVDDFKEETDYSSQPNEFVDYLTDKWYYAYRPMAEVVEF